MGGRGILGLCAHLSATWTGTPACGCATAADALYSCMGRDSMSAVLTPRSLCGRGPICTTAALDRLQQRRTPLNPTPTAVRRVCFWRAHRLLAGVDGLRLTGRSACQSGAHLSRRLRMPRFTKLSSRHSSTDSVTPMMMLK